MIDNFPATVPEVVCVLEETKVNIKAYNKIRDWVLVRQVKIHKMVEVSKNDSL